MNPYDYKPMGGESQYLKLTDKGDKAKVRIVSAPYRSLKVWNEAEHSFMDKERVATLSEEQIREIMANPDYTVQEVFTWKVIDREDGLAKVVSLPGSVFKKIGKLAKDEEWGDPTGYDITIERVEDPGNNYWGIQPSPNKSPLTLAEREAADRLDIAKLVVGAASLNDPNGQRLPAPEKVERSSIQGTSSELPDNTEDPLFSDQPLDPSEIPF